MPCKHCKFEQYWLSIGKPKLETKPSSYDVWKTTDSPQFLSGNDYRIVGDVHWELRLKWVNSDLKLPIEHQYLDGTWYIVNNPKWVKNSKFCFISFSSSSPLAHHQISVIN